MNSNQNNWEWKKIGEICNLVRGSSPRPKGDPRYYYGKIPRLMISDITRDGMYTTPKTDFLTEEGAKLSRPMKKGEVIMAVSGNPGLATILTIDACIHDGFVGFRELNLEIKPEFLYYYLKFYKELHNSQSVGAVFKNLNTIQIKQFKMPVPPITTQKHIVEILARIEKIKRNREKLNEETNKIIPSILYKMFEEDKYHTEEIRNHVEEVNSRDPTKKPDDIFKYLDISGIDNQQGSIKEYKEIIGKDAPSRARREIKENDVIISTVRPNLNATALIPKVLNNQIASTGFCILRCKKTINPRYLFSITRQKRFVDNLVSKMKGASYPAITNNDILTFKISIPPIPLQNQFASIVERVESIKQKQNQATTEINALSDTLIQKAFNGELTN
ncbi:restriction endonuclease subunit S [Candidatus Woesearchaeota archaeon]|nr:restriction endonuclease subunit S [Candidatus Woesearchaeota archaeon]